MLIKCPECGKEVSDKATSCIYCGYPFDVENKLCIINNTEIDLTTVFNEIILGESTAVVIKHIIGLYNMSLRDAKKLYDLIKETKKIPINFNCEAITPISQPNTPKCPTCGSTNVRPISASKRMVGTLTFGLASGTMGKSYECLNCKYKW